MDDCVIPVGSEAALAWAGGRLSDADLILRARLAPEAVFLVNLPNLAAYRHVVRRCLYWRDRGAVFMVTRTGNPVVDDHIVLKNHGRETYREPWAGAATKYRFILLPEAFDFWLDKVRPRKSVSPHVSIPAPSSERV